MNSRTVLLALSAVALVTVGLTASFKSSGQASQGISVNAGSQARPFFATHITSLGESVEVDLNVSLLPPVALADGSLVRPLSMRALYELEGGLYLGEARVHMLVRASSDEIIDLSATGLDIALHDTSPGGTEKLRAYTVQVMPVNGKRWSDVRSLKDDVLVIAERQ